MLSQFICTYSWLLFLSVLIAFLKSPFMKGVFGEFQVNLAATFFLDKDSYKIFNNVILPTEDGTTQIDHVIVSRYGVFVIETKNMKGWIFGSPQQKTWTQKIYRHSTQFQNPLHQNFKHTKTLLDALELDPCKVFSLIVFVGNSTFKTAMPDNVVYTSGYIRFIKSKQVILLSETEIQAIGKAIQSDRIKPSFKTQVDHVRHVKSIVQTKSNQAENTCPKCGMPMVLRTTRNGDNQGKQFLGCSSYPKCRMVEQLT